MDAHYRIATLHPDDSQAASVIEARCFPDPWRRPDFADMLALPDVLGLAARKESALVGYALVREAAGEAEILNLAVDPAHRRRGIGRALLDRAITWIEQRSAGEIFLEVRRSNREAQALYRTLGFTLVGLRTRYYAKPREDALVFRRILSRSALPGSRTRRFG